MNITLSSIRKWLWNNIFCSHSYRYTGFDKDGKPWVRQKCRFCEHELTYPGATYVDASGAICLNLTPGTIQKILDRNRSSLNKLNKHLTSTPETDKLLR